MKLRKNLTLLLTIATISFLVFSCAKATSVNTAETQDNAQGSNSATSTACKEVVQANEVTKALSSKKSGDEKAISASGSVTVTNSNGGSATVKLNSGTVITTLSLITYTNLDVDITFADWKTKDGYILNGTVKYTANGTLDIINKAANSTRTISTSGDNKLTISGTWNGSVKFNVSSTLSISNLKLVYTFTGTLYLNSNPLPFTMNYSAEGEIQ